MKAVGSLREAQPEAAPAGRARFKRSISVIMPVYNEAEVLDATVTEVDAFMRSNFEDYEILLIESGSTDGSAEFCDRLAEHHEAVKVIHEARRNGFGAALKLGYARANKELVWLVTPDIPFPLTAILAAVPLLDDYEYVYSYRSSDERALSRRIQSMVYNRMVRLLLGLRARHVNSAFKVFRRRDLAGFPLVSDGWFLDAELLVHAAERGLRGIEIPVPLIDRTRGTSTVGMSTWFGVLKELWAFRKRRRPA